MSRFSRVETLYQMEHIGLIPVFYHSEYETCKEIVKACFRGGTRCIEYTNRGDAAIDIYIKLEDFVKKNLPDVILGTGSICDPYTASLYINYGANFIVGPVFDKEIAIICNKRKIPYSPGCATITEIHLAHSYGVEICKVFPGDIVGGPSFVKAIKKPCPWVSIMPTGGVRLDRKSLEEWFNAGITCVGIGSELISKEIISTRNFKLLQNNVNKTIDLIKSIRISKK